MQQIGGRQSTRELVLNVSRLGIHHVADAAHRGRGQRALVHRAENRRVAVAINQAGGDVKAVAVNQKGFVSSASKV